ncbi:porin [Pseudoteredinibacter isoporae]|uniref:Putative porin n=1 Tax=Pseudoteredinibacter isoporae TaxID=570281 RepID=A0A7X0MY71_9GAMM|nr:porin [Pseudoteredinibacter isoporae]MBB6521702.1 putative porin [Pseudoteredinibacter isoporae]NHO87250.1 porin [Pseudoteredinibacter isoporae]NIB23118.1 porin [Pseudoteredinibacter isoporae]
MKTTLRKAVLFSSLASIVFANSAFADDAKMKAMEDRIAQLENMLKQQMEAQKQQSAKLQSVVVNVEDVEQMAKAAKLAAVEAKPASSKYGLNIYGSLRPRLTFRDEGDQSSTDITDALSRIGIKGSKKISSNLTAFYRGEWDVDIEANGNFGDARLAYVGLEGDFGRVAIGKQWSPHYNIVAERSDIFNHRSSPFGYDTVAPFRTAELLSYSYSKGGLRIDSGIQINGNPAIAGNTGDTSQVSGPSHVDSGSFGLSYDFGNAYIGASFLQQKGDNDYERDLLGVAGSVNATENLYVAFTYQDISVSEIATPELDQYTYDLVASYALGDGYKLKAGIFGFDDDISSADSDTHDGYNLTFEKQFSDVRLFAEWLTRDFDHKDKRNTLSIGLRYDFDLAL